MERKKNDRIAKSVYVGDYAGTHSVGRLHKRLIDTMKSCLRKRGFDVRQARRMVQDRSEWRGRFEREYMGRIPRDENLTSRCCSCGLPQVYEVCE